MPIYEFRCMQCDTEFEELCLSSTDASSVSCPQCKDTRTERLMSLFAVANVWLNYFLSIERVSFVYLVWVGVIAQSVLMALFHQALWQLPAVMAINGLWLTLAGGATLIVSQRTSGPR